MAAETATPAAPQLPPVTGDNVASYVEKFIKLRNKIKEIEEEHKNQLAPYKTMLLTLNNMLLGHLHATGADNISLKEIGTFYKIVKTTASLADADAFRRHVIGGEAWDLLDWRANSTAVKQFIEEHGEPPPGVNISSIVSAGVRKA